MANIHDFVDEEGNDDDDDNNNNQYDDNELELRQALAISRTEEGTRQTQTKQKSLYRDNCMRIHVY